jgi:hypothetical protein
MQLHTFINAAPYSRLNEVGLRQIAHNLQLVWIALQGVMSQGLLMEAVGQKEVQRQRQQAKGNPDSTLQ